MKKNKLLVILSIALTLSCLLSVLSMNAFAGALQGMYYETNPEYTAITNTYGYSSVAFTGNNYDDDPSRNNAILAAEAQGGRLADFTTKLSARITFLDVIELDSDIVGTRRLSATITGQNNDLQMNAVGSSEQSCKNHNNGMSSDSWQRLYTAKWKGFPTGWVEYTVVPTT